MKMDAEVIVIGGGIVGLWTAYHLVKQGIRTIVFEQFPYPHTRGSSHGQSRIIRSAYAEEEYASMMPECFRKWKQLQIESREELFLKTGLIIVFNMTKADDVTTFYGMMDQMDKYAPEVEIIPGEDMKKRFPGLNFDSKHRAIYDESAGLLKADKCLLVLQELVVKHGGKIFDGEGVLSIHHVNASKVNVETKKKTYSSQSVIIACGPFTNKLLSSVGIQLPLERTPDYGFIIDHHPKFKNIVIGAGFSGHGFKTAPSVGHMLSNMALGLLTPYSSEPFAIKRFNKKSML